MVDSSPIAAPRHLLLAGGGSGGHVFPALAVGEELAGRGWAVSFTGAPTGMEARLVPSRGVAFHPLAARPLVGRGIAGKARALGTLGRATLAGVRLLGRLGVDVVVGTGGYASAPAVLAAVLTRRPVLLVEPNARAGFANRQLARWAAGAALAFAETASDLRCPTRVTGVPVRREFFERTAAGTAEPAAARGPRILVLGGSQGAVSLNLGVPAALGGADGLAATLPGLEVLHQAGRGHLDATRAAYRAAGLLSKGVTGAAPAARFRLVEFLDDVAGEMTSAHLVVSRAGAITVAEITAAARAAILVPLTLAEGHQKANAEALAAAGAARVVAAEPGDIDALVAALRPALADVLGDGERLAAMGRAAERLARPGAAAAIADWADELARTRGRAA